MTNPKQLNRQEFITRSGMALGVVAAAGTIGLLSAKSDKPPNIILLMADDLGWGDLGFNGNEIISTPHLDKLATNGLRFDRFYTGGPVCSPTRATCLTGRHYMRHGIWNANQGRLVKQEITISSKLKEKGYATGIFGKWHLGLPHPEYRGKGGAGNEAFPQWFGFDEHFVTHHAVATWNPYGEEGEQASTDDNPYYHNGERVIDNITGDDSRIIMDRALPFIKKSVEQDQPFLSVIWFHAPHKPFKAGPEHRAMYSDYSDTEQHYYGCVTALDQQVGRLIKELEETNSLDNTMLWFCSDNGPENGTPGQTGGLRGRKRSLFSGGVGSAAFLHWPDWVDGGAVTNSSASTLDYLPTIFDLLDIEIPEDRPIDGTSLAGVIKNHNQPRIKAIPFRYVLSKEKMHDSPTISIIDGDYKFLTNLSADGNEDMLFNVVKDRTEKFDIIDQYPDIASRLKAEAVSFVESAKASYSGKDNDDPNYKPAGPWLEVGGWKKNMTKSPK